MFRKCLAYLQLNASATFALVFLLGACGEDPPSNNPQNQQQANNNPPANSCPSLGTMLPAGTAPIRRGDAASAYDPGCQRIYMVFGDIGEPEQCGFAPSVFLSDAYVYEIESGTWWQLDDIPQNGPLPRARSRAIWDRTRERLVVFGGRWRLGTEGAYTFLNDVWAFEPSTNTWDELSPVGGTGPSGRMNHTMHYDHERDRFIVHGGGTTNVIAFQPENDTWAFNLETNTWSPLGTGALQPPGRLFHASGLDTNQQRLYVFAGGGEDAFFTFFRDMWVLDLASDTWSEVQLSGRAPAGRIKAEMDYDAPRNRLVLFAGHDDTSLGNANDVWAFDLTQETWAQMIVGDVFNRPAFDICDFPGDFTTADLNSPERRESHNFHIIGERAFTYGGRTDCGLANDTWLLDITTNVWSQENVSPTGMTCPRSGAIDCVSDQARLCD